MTNLNTIALKTAELIDNAPQTPKPITDAMVAQYPMLAKIALHFVREYKGTNSFVQDIAVKLHDTGNLSVPQMRGALNVMIAEARQAQKLITVHDTIKPFASTFHIDMQPSRVAISGESVAQRATTERAIAGLAAIEAVQIPNGTYTVPINDDGEYRVIKLVDCPEKFNKPASTQIAEYQSGADNERDYTGFAFVTGTTSQVWRKFHNAREIQFALTKLLTLGKAQEFGKIWAMASERCYICGRKLTTPESKQAGIGPICAENNGISMAAMILMGTKAAAIEENDMRDAQAKINDLFPE